MKSELEEDAYRLSLDVEHYRRCGLDWNKDIVFQRYDGYVSYLYFETQMFPHPNPVVFEGSIDVVRHIDFPETDNDWLVMSSRMYDALKTVGEFPHRILPVVITDTRLNPRDWYDSSGNLRKETALWNYVAVQTTKYLDVFDYEKSKYNVDEDDRQEITVIGEYVFKAPPGGLPPLFRIPERVTSVFVSSEARRALREAEITGTRYISLKGYKGEEERDWVDVPIFLPEEVYQ